MEEEAVAVQTRSVEFILSLLVAQTTTLVNWQAQRWAAGAAEATGAAGAARAASDLLRAIERFATLGELLAAQEPELGPAALQACDDIRGAGKRIAQLMGTGVTAEKENNAASGHPHEQSQRSGLPEAALEHPLLERVVMAHPSLERTGLEQPRLERAGLERAARLLLSSVARTLLLADRAAVKHIMGFRNQVLRSLEGLEAAESSAEMVPAFNNFSEAIEPFVNLSAEREKDVKDERQAAWIAAPRDVLEKSPMMLLTACKTLLAHGDCEAARAARGHILGRVRAALSHVADAVREPPPTGGCAKHRGPAGTTVLPDGTVAVSLQQTPVPESNPGASIGAYGGLAETAVYWLYGAVDALKAHVEALREGRPHAGRPDRARPLLGAVRGGVRAFAEAGSVSGEHRERLLRLTAQVHGHVEALADAGDEAVSRGQSDRSHETELTLIAACQTLEQLKQQLHVTAVATAMGLLSSRPGEHELARFKREVAAGRAAAVRDLAAQLTERQEALSEVCWLLRHVAETEPLGIRCCHLDNCIRSNVQQVVCASEVLAQNPESQSAQELFEVCRQAWAECLAGLAVLVRNAVEVSRGAWVQPRRGKVAQLLLPGTVV